MDLGDVAYFLPMCQFPLADIDTDYDFLKSLFEFFSKEKLKNFDLISGYLNPTDEMIELLSEIDSENLTFIGAAPEVN